MRDIWAVCIVGASERPRRSISIIQYVAFDHLLDPQCALLLPQPSIQPNYPLPGL